MGLTKKEIALIISGVVLVFAGLLFFDDDQYVKLLLAENKTAFKAFAIAFVVLGFVTGITYGRTLDFVDMPTAPTVRVTLINIVLWCVFWIYWSVFNAIVLFHYPGSMKVILFSFLLTNLPGVGAAIFSESVRKEELADRESWNSGATPEEIALYDKMLQRRYCIFIYGIITVPVYVIMCFLLYAPLHHTYM